MSISVTVPSAIADLRASTALTITRAQAAAYLGVDPRTVTTGIEEGNIPAVRLGRRIVIPRERFLKLFEVESD
ncbi:helix-turn-helix domain-containing protein [Leucobacter sp. HNU]|uniref:helix-turn-helix domain-containing protein n=1 Tax=Leucobacter sp. HNU TaxID=3236805 RepID=UPI003A813070